jgi:nucleoside-diphosphate-sugar epimerase
MAERSAWDFVENGDVGFDLVVINPVGVIGPSIVPRVNETDSVFIGMPTGTVPAIVAIDHPYVDVRDVALAHIRAMETSEASGRFLTAAGNLTMRQMAEFGSRMLGDRYRFPRLKLDRGFGLSISRALLPFQPQGTRDFLNGTLGRLHRVDNSESGRSWVSSSVTSRSR